MLGRMAMYHGMLIPNTYMYIVCMYSILTQNHIYRHTNPYPYLFEIILVPKIIPVFEFLAVFPVRYNRMYEYKHKGNTKHIQ